MLWIRSPRRAVLTGVVVGLLLLVGDGTVSAVGRSAADLRTAEIPVASSPPGIVTSSGFVPPVTGTAAVLNPFRTPASRYGAGHRGVDLAAALGDPVRAAAAGIIVYAGRLAGRGVISIDHPVGLRTTYEPVTATVRAGDPVLAGQSIGGLEAGHISCAPAVCLHWGARLPDGSYLDPISLLSGLRVRLLPWDG